MSCMPSGKYFVRNMLQQFESVILITNWIRNVRKDIDAAFSSSDAKEDAIVNQFTQIYRRQCNRKVTTYLILPTSRVRIKANVWLFVFSSVIVPLLAIFFEFLCNLIHEGIDDDQCISTKDGGEVDAEEVYSDEDEDWLLYQQAIRNNFIYKYFEYILRY